MKHLEEIQMNKDISKNRNMCIYNRDYCIWFLHVYY